MIVVELYSKDDCHLCDEAKELLIKIQKSIQFELRQIKIHEGDEIYKNYNQRVPVILIDGEFAFQYRVPPVQFIKKLQHAIQRKKPA